MVPLMTTAYPSCPKARCLKGVPEERGGESFLVLRFGHAKGQRVARRRMVPPTPSVRFGRGSGREGRSNHPRPACGRLVLPAATVGGDDGEACCSPACAHLHHLGREAAALAMGHGLGALVILDPVRLNPEAAARAGVSHGGIDTLPQSPIQEALYRYTSGERCNYSRPLSSRSSSTASASARATAFRSSRTFRAAAVANSIATSRAASALDS